MKYHFFLKTWQIWEKHNIYIENALNTNKKSQIVLL